MTENSNGHSPALTPPKWALVITHMLNPNLVQGFPMYLSSADDVREHVHACMKDGGGAIDVLNAEGDVQLTLILGPGMTFQVEDWVGFSARMQEMQRQQAAFEKAQREARVAAQLGIGGPVRLPKVPG